jgi:hypothetical protein
MHNSQMWWNAMQEKQQNNWERIPSSDVNLSYNYFPAFDYSIINKINMTNYRNKNYD